MLFDRIWKEKNVLFEYENQNGILKTPLEKLYSTNNLYL